MNENNNNQDVETLQSQSIDNDKLKGITWRVPATGSKTSPSSRWTTNWTFPNNVNNVFHNPQ